MTKFVIKPLKRFKVFLVQFSQYYKVIKVQNKNMPKYEKVRKFGEVLGQELGYQILDEAPESRVLVLGKNKSDLLIGGQSE